MSRVLGRYGPAKLDPSDSWKWRVDQLQAEVEAAAKEVDREVDWARTYVYYWKAFDDWGAWGKALAPDASAAQYEQVLRLAEGSRKLSERDPWATTAQVLAFYRLGRYEDAVAVSLEGGAWTPRWYALHGYARTMCLAHIPEPEEEPLDCYARARLAVAALPEERDHAHVKQLRAEAETVLRERLGVEDPEAPYKALLDSGFIGVAVESADEGGLRVTSVVKDSPAAAAGLQKEDVILRLAGKETTDDKSFVKLAQSLKPGDEVDVEVRRGDTPMTLKVKVGRLGDHLR